MAHETTRHERERQDREASDRRLNHWRHHYSRQVRTYRAFVTGHATAGELAAAGERSDLAYAIWIGGGS